MKIKNMLAGLALAVALTGCQAGIDEHKEIESGRLPISQEPSRYAEIYHGGIGYWNSPDSAEAKDLDGDGTTDIYTACKDGTKIAVLSSKMLHDGNMPISRYYVIPTNSVRLSGN